MFDARGQLDWAYVVVQRWVGNGWCFTLGWSMQPLVGRNNHQIGNPVQLLVVALVASADLNPQQGVLSNARSHCQNLKSLRVADVGCFLHRNHAHCCQGTDVDGTSTVFTEATLPTAADIAPCANHGRGGVRGWCSTVAKKRTGGNVF